MARVLKNETPMIIDTQDEVDQKDQSETEIESKSKKESKVKIVRETKSLKDLKRRLLLGVKSFFLVMFLFSFGLFLGLYYYGMIEIFPRVYQLHEEAEQIFLSLDENGFAWIEPTRIYAADGTFLGSVGGMNCKAVPIDQISPYIQKAYLAMEDRRFYEHDGLDFKSLSRAAVSIIKNRSITQGGSTITQQIIKNNVLTQERTFDRKVKEFFIAPWVDATKSKDDIMAIYCNTNYYANNCYGVEVASQYYFGKSAADVSIREASILASLSARPSGCDPKEHQDALKARSNLTIQTMFDQGLISKQECESALAEWPEFLYQREKSTGIEPYPVSYAIHCAALRLMEQDGFTFRYLFTSEEDEANYKALYNEIYQRYNKQVRAGGYSIYTSIDIAAQEALQQSVDVALAGSTELQEDGRYALQGAAVAIDNVSGNVVAIVGGRGTEDSYNRAFLSYRQPASAIKPLLVFAPAFDMGYSPDSIVNDSAIYGGPKNAYGSFLGDISLRTAMERSTNTVAYKLLQEITVPRAMSVLEAMRFRGITFNDRYNILTSLGGFDYGCRVVDMARGYFTLVNDGIWTNQDCIINLEYQNKGPVCDLTVQKQQVYSTRSASQTIDSMKGVLTSEYGTGHASNPNNITAFAKTGSSNGSRDSWFCGGSAYYTVAVWSGFDMPKDIPGIDANTYSGRIWKSFMEQIHNGLPIKDVS